MPSHSARGGQLTRHWKMFAERDNLPRQQVNGSLVA
jgi:hypothetical protein